MILIHRDYMILIIILKKINILKNKLKDYPNIKKIIIEKIDNELRFLINMKNTIKIFKYDDLNKIIIEKNEKPPS